ncbi:MAG: hypothetical protein HOW73_09080 [Polyangiaceae bacterium]|nr:hypothetical protein [Polyangiaceae bacterium]
MARFWSLALASTIVTVAAPAFAQVGSVDQVSSTGGAATSASFNRDSPSLIWQQQIRAGMAGKLEGIAVTIDGNAGANFSLGVRFGAAPSAQPVLYQQLVTKSVSGQQTIFIDMSSANILLQANDVFVMEAHGTGNGVMMLGSYVAPPGAPLYAEPLYLGNGAYADGHWRLGFTTYVIPLCPNGLPCDDGNACTIGDTCAADGFTCVPGTPVVCMPSAACHEAGICDASTGLCSDPIAADGTACDDGDACTATDICNVGMCSGSGITCDPPGECHDAGTCEPADGSCIDVPKADGTPCSIGTCLAGNCVGGEGGGGEGGAGGEPPIGGNGQGGSPISNGGNGSGGSPSQGGNGGEPAAGGSGGGGDAPADAGCDCRMASKHGAGTPASGALVALGLAALARRRRRHP